MPVFANLIIRSRISHGPDTSSRLRNTRNNQGNVVMSIEVIQLGYLLAVLGALWLIFSH